MLFGILGSVEAHHEDGTAVAVGGPRVRSLLALLLLDAGRIVPTETLVDALYGEEPPAGAANALQSQVSRLRRGLRDEAGTDKLVEFHAAGYRLSVTPDQVDAHRFTRLARDGRQALASGRHAEASELLGSALALWRGPAFADILHAPFAPARSAAWEEHRLDALADRIEADLALGRHQDVLGELRQLVAAHPLRERLVGQLMRALYGAGRQADALAVYEDTRRLLADELGTDPSADLAALHLDILRAAPSLTTASPAPAPGPSAAPEPAAPTAPEGPERRGLPAALTSFVGRDAELARIAELSGRARLITLTGPGGTGKTRLSVEAGRRAEGDVCFVDLAPVRREDELAQTVLSALGLRGGSLMPAGPGQFDDDTERLITGLATRELLLILDNCEQVVADVARLTHRLLAACPGVRVLATSREALGITGESLCPVPRLALPAPDASPDEALASPAVRLFADRAAAVRPDFVLDAGTVPIVQAVCDALDGLPLAIELAAARLRALPLAQVAARLDDRFRLLSRGDRAAAPRHQTLRAVVEWSWELLDEAEQTLARRLTVFPGGATIEAAARVCGVDEDEVVDLLADLADKSLIEPSGPDDAGPYRYRMFETIRLYGAERLDEAGERAALEKAHAAYFLEFADHAEPYLRTREQLEWLARLRADHANLRAAVRWAVDADPVAALRLGAALAWYWWLRGVRYEAAVPNLELIGKIGPVPPDGMTEEYLMCLMTAIPAVDPATGAHADLLGRALPLMNTLPHKPRRPQMWVMVGMAVGPDAGRQDPAWALMGEDPWSRAILHIGQGFMALYGGELPAARAEFEESLARFRKIGDQWGIANSIDQLAVLEDWSGDLTGALALTDEALDMMGRLGITEDIDDLLVRRGDMRLRAGDPEGARADYERAMRSAQRTGRPMTAAGARCGLGVLARLAGDPGEARRLQEQALAECPSSTFGSEESVAGILTELAWTALELDEDTRTARGLAWATVEMTYARSNFMSAACGIEALAGSAARDGDAAGAAALLGLGAAVRGAAIPGQPDVARVTAAARTALGAAEFETAYTAGAAVPRTDVVEFVARFGAG
ncbi:BTAD domain-containing putative transcriptional regulator [Yinghuangia aomiensis]|uniref:BTAD domain-containing putative transcriptional regulator n=1 Tax=Yinghuangia aomiensis TaxID=676205 RepID=A0ABP9HLS2_9ACTN